MACSKVVIGSDFHQILPNIQLVTFVRTLSNEHRIFVLQDKLHGQSSLVFWVHVGAEGQRPLSDQKLDSFLDFNIPERRLELEDNRVRVETRHSFAQS